MLNLRDSCVSFKTLTCSNKGTCALSSSCLQAHVMSHLSCTISHLHYEGSYFFIFIMYITTFYSNMHNYICYYSFLIRMYILHSYI